MIALEVLAAIAAAFVIVLVVATAAETFWFDWEIRRLTIRRIRGA
jgi:hypothetical protein